MLKGVCSVLAIGLALSFTGLSCSRTPMDGLKVMNTISPSGGASTVASGGTTGTIGNTGGGGMTSTNGGSSGTTLGMTGATGGATGIIGNTASSSASLGGVSGGSGIGGVSGGASASRGGRGDGGVLGGTLGTSSTGGRSFGGNATTSGAGIGGTSSLGQAGVTTSGGGGGASGLGGGGGSGGTGGTCAAGSTLPCTCDNGMSGSLVCLPSQVYSECVCGTPALMRVRNGFIGTWTGTATAFGNTWPVTFTFDSYTHYSAKSLQAGISALYYGSDDDSPLKLYNITDLQANGDANGTIVIYFSANDTNLDNLQGIELSADGSHLQFYFMHFGANGPLQYDLQRVTP